MKEQDDQRDAAVAEAVAAANLSPDETPAPGSYEKVREALLANRANTLALLGCLRAVPEPVPFREAEAAVAGTPALSLTMQNPHALFDILMKCGAVASEAVPEVVAEAQSDEVAPEAVAAVQDGEEALPDKPVDYTLCITDWGRRALAEFEPTKRFTELMADEPEGYADAYARVLARCEQGASKAQIEAELEGHAALAHPKQIYPGYFISKLETVDGITWDGLWRTTDAGRRMAAQLR